MRTVLSGISAGTELTQYRGTNPYLARRWDGAHRVFVDGVPPLRYPLDTWGYQEVGRVDAVGPDVDAVAVGTLVWGAWNHRSSVVVDADAVAQRQLPGGVPARLGSSPASAPSR